jgi:hypothetical protein
MGSYGVFFGAAQHTSNMMSRVDDARSDWPQYACHMAAAACLARHARLAPEIGGAS